MFERSKEFEKASQEVHTIIDKLGDAVPPNARQLAEEAIAKMKVDNLLPREALGFTPEMMEVFYRHGYSLFQSGKFKEARNVFEILRYLDITDVRYSFCIAACHHHAKEYLDAAAYYIACNYLDPSDPIPCFHLYDCFMKTDYPLSALLAIEQARLLAMQNPVHETLKDKIDLEYDYLQRFLKTYLKEKFESGNQGDLNSIKPR